MSSNNIKIMVVTHKEAPMPENKELYVPTLVGPNKDMLKYETFFRDDQGEDNITEKNPNFCELTALYWAWKNLDADFIGLVHYRRLLMNPNDHSVAIDQTQLDQMINQGVEVILPVKRNYYIETTWSHYEHNHNINDLIEVKNILGEQYPEYLESFDKVMGRKKSHRFNMLIMKKNRFDAYSKWLFDILFELEKRVDISDYDAYQARIFGFISERLLDVWLEANEVVYEEVPFKFTEKQNWVMKGSKFIGNKINARGVKNGSIKKRIPKPIYGFAKNIYSSYKIKKFYNYDLKRFKSGYIAQYKNASEEQLEAYLTFLAILLKKD